MSSSVNSPVWAAVANERQRSEDLSAPSRRSKGWMACVVIAPHLFFFSACLDFLGMEGDVLAYF